MTVGDDAWMRAALERLVRIESTSGDEVRAQIEVERLMVDAGASEVRRVPVEPAILLERYGFSSPSRTAGMFSVVGSWIGDAPGQHVVLNGHIDTVGAGTDWTTDACEPHEAAGRMTGLGVADMKSGLVSAIAAAARSAASGFMIGRVDVQSVPDEEGGGGTGTLACIDELLERGERRPDFAIVCEPTQLQIATTQVGSRSLAVRFHGVEAHANTKFRGLSAVELAVDLSRHLLSWPDEQTSPPHPLLPPRAVNIGKIVGGDGATKVAARCDLEMCITYHPTDADAVVRGIDFIIDRWYREQDDRLRIEVTELHNVQPFSTEAGHPVLARLAAAADVAKDSFVGFPAGSDGRLLSGLLGVPTVLFGPGDIGLAHRPNESVPLSELFEHSRFLERFLLGPPDGAPSPHSIRSQEERTP